ncbi:class I SAM-dependent methyltransferase [Streptomyces sp. NBC_00249]|uniref:class I SAM-dependent methyltransferase n=1 Tax=Streptomyces sp. NBC_00249 TaxID=2975690 RepID=UPI00224DB9C6|nr:class I SAM-dependent methyltransferase [Streptomyces sp. NBC_00249]MCX5198130.1 class I SAM-dependent methyltransferase [Streptomyces sp. NBC_00249]
MSVRVPVEEATTVSDHQHQAHHQHQPHEHSEHDHARHQPDPDQAPQDYWDGRYLESDRMWSGEPNPALVREVSELPPGRALDLGCGEGADSVWLARQGWRVTGTDISGVALERAALHAAEAGLADRVEWQRHDLAESFPEGEFDLVSACFLHSFGDFPREKILRAAVTAVAPGGVLLVVGHGGWAPWQEDKPELDFPTADEVLAQLELPDGAWEVLVAEEYERTQCRPDGRPGTRTDNTLKVRRRA